MAKHSSIGARSEQQDLGTVLRRRDHFLIALADGMGGHADGRVASRAAVEAARRAFTRCAPRDLDDDGFLPSIINEAHADLRRCTSGQDISSTTLSLVLMNAETVSWAYCGDTRVYRLLTTNALERTQDHSIVELQRMRGKVSEADMGTHADQNRLFSSVGGSSDPEIDTGRAPIDDHHAVLVATDGFWEHQSVEEIREVLTAPHLNRTLAHAVQTAVMRAGEKADNTTVIVARSPLSRLQRALTRMGL